ncbi:MAG: potassium channel family protein [Chloroflexota bacterium]|nr:potassium channel family protein [Chloroflexota bacterium]
MLEYFRQAALAENIIIALFAAELVVKVAVAENRLRYLRTHWLDVLIVVLPLLRPLRVLRILRLLPILARGALGLRRVMGPYHGGWVLLIGLGSVLLSAVLVTVFEHGADSTIKTFGDALWWAATTVTTVGYGDKFPVTPEGRAVAVFLMVIGIALFGMFTAAIAAYFVDRSAKPEDTITLRDLMDKLDKLEARVEELQTQQRSFERVDRR